MSTIDTRVVEAKFKNDQFGAGVSSTLSALDRLKAGLKLDGAANGLKEVSAAATSFDSSAMEQGAGRIGGAFSSMQAVAFGALASIGAKAVAVGGQVLNSFTLAPITAGFQEYELKMGSIQTILANTAKYGTKLPQVNKSLDELNNYADQTIYNFGDMTKNIGLFTNAGIRVEDATSMIKGFSNSAAASGTSAEGAASAAYQLSQALSAGKVTLMDWRSLQNVGMGNKNMQSGIIELASAMGTFKGTGTDATKATKDFNGSLEKGWLKADVMSNYLKIMSGDMSDAQIAALGLSDAQVKAFRDTANTGYDAATKVRTFTQLMGTLKEAVGSGWSESFGYIFGDFNDATTLFTSLSDSIGGFVKRMSDSRNALLKQWADMGGRKAAIDGMKSAFVAILSPLAAIGKGFRDVFPAMTADRLVALTKGFADFMAEIKPGPETLDRIRRTAAGLFAIFHIGWTVIKAVAGFLGDLFLGFSEGDQGILRFTASIGDFLVGLDKAISSGQGLTSFFDTLTKLVFKIVNPIRDFGQLIGKMFEGLDLGAVGGTIGDLATGLLTLGDSTKAASGGLGLVKGAISGLASIAGKVADWAASFGTTLINAFSNIDYDALMAGLQTGVLAGLTGVLWKLTGAIKGFNLFGGKGGPGGIFSSIKDGLEQVSGTMKAMQNNLNASALMKLAAAIAILAVSVVLLASVDAPGLTRATIAMTVMFGQLALGMKQLTKAVGYGGAAKLNLLAPALILIGVAIGIMALSVKALADLSWEELQRGLTGLGTMLIMISGAVKVMSGNTRGMATASAGLILISIAIKNLVGSVKDFADMNWEDLRKGLIGVGALLVGMALFTKFAEAGAGGLAQGAGILLLSMAIKNLVQAVTDMAKLSWEDIGKGLSALTLGLAGMGVALKLIPPSSILSALAAVKVAEALSTIADVFIKLQQLSWEELARGMVALGASFGVVILAMQGFQKVNILKMAGIWLVAQAIQVLSGALTTMSGLSYDELGRGLTALAGTLLILTVAMRSMEGSILGAAALVVVAGALTILTPILLAFSQLSLAEMATALGMLAGVFLILGVAAYSLAGAVPVLLGLGLAIGLLGAAVFLAGVGVLAFATGLAILAAAGAGATVAIVAIVSGLIGLIPMVIEQIGKGIVAFAKVIAASGPAIVGAITAVLMAFLDSIIKIIPKLMQTLETLLTAFLKFLTRNTPRLVQAGFDLLLALLTGIDNNIDKIVDRAVDIIVKFVNGVSRNLPKIIQAGINLILAFMNGIGDAARNNGDKLADAAWNMASGLVEGFIKGLGSLAGKVKDAAVNMAKKAWDGALDWLGIHSPSRRFIQVGKYTSEGFAIGLAGNKEKIQDAVKTMMGQLTDAMAGSKTDIANETKKINDLIGKRAENMRQIGRANADLARAQAKEVGSTAKTASARAAEIKRETEARNAAIRAAQERIRKLGQTQKKYDKDIAAGRKARDEMVGEQKRILAAQASLKGMASEQKHLELLANQHDLYEEKIKDATKSLEDATKTRDDYNKSLRDSFGAQEAVTKDTHLKDYVKNLQQQIVDTQKFNIAIQELRRRGLNDEMYKQLLGTGLSAMPFMQEVLAGGKGAVTELNTLGSSLDKAAGKIGNGASSSLYQAGVDAAEGLLKGLQNKQKDIEAQMDKIADHMVNTIKMKLGIKSPSRVFAEMGAYSAEGLAKGLSDSSAVVGRSAEGLGQTAIDSMKRTISGLGDLISGDVDLNPVVTPVLDLSSIRKDASGIGSLLSAQPLSIDGTYSKASAASAGYSANQRASVEAATAEPPAPITFIQNNNSPKALSSAELYRQTNNQISVAKGALTSNAR